MATTEQPTDKPPDKSTDQASHRTNNSQHWLYAPLPSILQWWSQQNHSPQPTLLEIRLFLTRPTPPLPNHPPPPKNQKQLLLLLPTSTKTWSLPGRCFLATGPTRPPHILAAALSMLQHAIEERALLDLQFLDINHRLPYDPILTFLPDRPQPTLRCDLVLFAQKSTLDRDSIINASAHELETRSKPMFTAIRWTNTADLATLALHPEVTTSGIRHVFTRFTQFHKLHTDIRAKLDINSLITFVRFAILTKLSIWELDKGSQIPHALIAVDRRAPFAGLWVIDTGNVTHVKAPEGSEACIESMRAVPGGGLHVDYFLVVGQVREGKVWFAGEAGDLGPIRRLMGAVGGDGTMKVRWLQRTKMTKLGSVVREANGSGLKRSADGVLKG
ncbi:unnamed protein product [Zymoseptoria tritici ST99CH_1A5]|uniref:Uncharacterized protein n=1 Tax=Zymoseptoria tritici ST99CH_1A5 TaxID=1276529 RepID=A0A1Y6LTD7_ZYMTR|nr:unnamed protein product [Zymoseptoria tritici ST99CH_1A5]